MLTYRATLLTGQYPSEHEVRMAGERLTSGTDNLARSLSEVVRRQRCLW